MSALPAGWVEVPLCDVVTNRDRDRVPVNAKERAERVGDVPYYGATGQVGWIDEPLFDEELLALGEDGVQFFDPLAPKAYLISGPAWVNNHAHVLVSQDEGVSLRYLKYYLDQFHYRGFANGTTRLKLTQAAMNRIPVRLAPGTEQQRIVAELERRLSHIDAAERSIQAALRKVQAAKASVREATRTGVLLPYIDPTTWDPVTAGDVSDVRGGIQKQPKRKPVLNKYPFLRVANVGRGVMDLAEVHEVELFNGELMTYRLEPGDLLVVEGNGSVDQIGRAARWDGSIADCVHQNHLIRVRPGERLDSRFLELVWNSPSTTAQLIAAASSTSGLHTLSTGKIKGIQLRIPPLQTQRVLAAEAARMLSLLVAAECAVTRQLARCAAARSSILTAAFAGKLVPQDPSDEPATVLLERIKQQRQAAAPVKKSARKPRAKKETTT